MPPAVPRVSRVFTAGSDKMSAARSGFSGQPVIRCKTMAIPPSSAAQVMRFNRFDATRTANPSLLPKRFRTIANTGSRPTTAIRPHISM